MAHQHYVGLNNEKPNEIVSMKSTSIIAALLLATIFVLTITGCSPSEYSSAPLSGHVIDKVTKEPIANAYVVAIYGLHGGHNGNYVAPLHYEETRSDGKGIFHFNGFIDIPIDYSRAPKNAFVLDYDPLLFFFAEGYLPWDAFRNTPSKPPGSFLKSPLDGVIVELEPMSGDVQKDAEKSAPFIGGLETVISQGLHNGRYFSKDCTLNKIPQTKEYLLRMDKFFDENARYLPRIPWTSYTNCNK